MLDGEHGADDGREPRGPTTPRRSGRAAPRSGRLQRRQALRGHARAAPSAGTAPIFTAARRVAVSGSGTAIASS